MEISDVELFEGRVGGDAALEVSLPAALLAMVGRRERPAVLRFYRPPPTVAFGRRDSLLPGFSAAASAATRRGFTPVIRSAGGRAAAYDEGCIVIDEIMSANDPTVGIADRFADQADLLAAVLRQLGVDARVGEVRGEYCPGEFTVNARGRTKLIGSAQRIVRGAWLVSTVVVVRPVSAVRGVLEDVYAELELGWDPRTFGSVAAEAPGASIAELERALLDTYATRSHLIPGEIACAERQAAVELLDRHRVFS